MLSIVLALLTALSNATANVFQRRADARQPDRMALSPRLLAALVRDRVWLAGIGLVLLSFLLQASAVHVGALAVVQPVIVLELPLTLIIASRAFHVRVSWKTWAATGLLTAGVAAVLVGLAPSGSSGGQPSTAGWAFGVGLSAAVIAALVVAGQQARGDHRAALWGAAAGLTFGLTATFMKGATGYLSAGFVPFLTAWSTWAMAAAGLVALGLVQSALQAGRLVAAQPGVTLLDPLMAVCWGVVGFHEHVQEGFTLILAAAGAAAVLAGVVELARSPALAGPAPDDVSPGKKGDDPAPRS